MNDNTLIIPIDVAAVLIALGLLVTAISGLVATLRKSNQKMRQVETVINSRTSDQLERIDQLVQALDRRGIDVPPINKAREPGA